MCQIDNCYRKLLRVNLLSSACVWCELSFVIMQTLKLETSDDVLEGKHCERKISEKVVSLSKKNFKINFLRIVKYWTMVL